MFETLTKKNRNFVASVTLEHLNGKGGQSEVIRELVTLMGGMDKEILRLRELLDNQREIITDLRVNGEETSND